MSPPDRGADEAESYQAEPEVHENAQIHFEDLVSRCGGQIGRQEHVGRVTEEHGSQGLHEIRNHTLFRHRT
jgi:hypothetical protein